MNKEEKRTSHYGAFLQWFSSRIVKNVTRKSARRLWHYAITQAEDNPVNPSKVEWRGDMGLLKRREYAGRVCYDLVQQGNSRHQSKQSARVYYGVTEDGIHGEWARLVGLETNMSVDARG